MPASNRKVSNTDRQRLVTAYEGGEDFVALADVLGINRDTARSVIRVWREEGRVERLPRGGPRNRRVDEEMVATILEIAREEPFSTLTAIKEKLQVRLPHKPRVHISTIARHLENMLISLKIAGKDADVPHRRNTPTTKETRHQYAIWLTSLPVNHHVVYIDECGINLFTRRSQGRAPVGQPVRQRIVGARMANINLIMAINSDMGLVLYDLQQRTVNHERYQTFIDNLINNEAAHRFQGSVHIVHDGARPHLRTSVPEEHSPRFFIHTLPPYSPFLNPVEQAHSCFKAAVGRQLTSAAIQEELLDDAQRQARGLTQAAWRSTILLRIGNESIQEVTQVKCSHWCRRVDRFVPRSLGRIDIEG